MVAHWDGNRLTVWTSTQKVFLARSGLADLFDLPEDKIRVIGSKVGAGFGGKNAMRLEPHAAALALKTGKPVRLVNSRTEEFSAAAGSVPATVRVKTGVKKDGTLLAKQAEIYLNTGAYAETGPVVTGRTLTRILGPYRYPHLKINSYCVYTNTVSAASFRSIGGPQTAWATESQMDIIARKLGMDPVELRRKNLVKKGEEIRPKFRPLDADLQKGFKLVTEKLGWDGPVSKDGRGRGVGLCGGGTAPIVSERRRAGPAERHGDRRGPTVRDQPLG